MYLVYPAAMRAGTIKMRIDRVFKDHQTGKSQSRKIGNQTVSHLLLVQASKGDATAQFRLACCYVHGNDVTEDPTTAWMWFRKSAETGHVPAMVRLGEAYLDGEGTEQNRIRGLFWLLKAANLGSRDACATLGIRYYNGHRLPRNGDLAAKWLQTAVNRGCGSSLIGLASCYKTGNGVEKNIVMACAYIGVYLAKSKSESGWSSYRNLTKDLTDEQIAEVKRLSSVMINGRPLDL
jgi:TPR repeat protein